MIEVTPTQVWVADDAHFTGVGVCGTASPDPSNPIACDDTNYTYTSTAAAAHMCDSSVKVLDQNYPAGPYIIYTNGCYKSDELGYGTNGTSKWVLVGNSEENSALVTNPNAGVPTAPFVTLINADLSNVTPPDGYTPGAGIAPAAQILAQIAFNGTNNTPNATAGIEMPVYSSATGLFYVSVPADGVDDENGAIAVIDPVNKVALTKIPLTQCAPSGMALGPDGQEVFLACANSNGLQVVSLVNSGSVTKGQVLATISLASLGSTFDNGCDEAWYNPSLNQYMTACQPNYGDNAYVPIIDAGTGLDGSAIKLQQTLNVGGAYTHSVASDPVTGAIFVPLQPGDTLCPTASVGCIGVWAPEGGALQRGIY